MIRKQLYLTREQNRALKLPARALGVSEAELVRRALDDLIREGSAHLPEGAPGESPLAALLENTRRLAARRRLPSGYRFDRDALYERER